jgi:hypothetical protein
MGGIGSGRKPLTPEERKARGLPEVDEAGERRRAEKVIAGPWLTKIPEPEIPLSEIGRKKYDELTRTLLEQNKLTQVTCMQAEIAARMHAKIAALAAKGKYPSASDFNQLQRALTALKIAEDAQPIGTAGGKVNKFAGLGFANRGDQAVRLRAPAAPGSRK